jgi:hypothetical protein
MIIEHFLTEMGASRACGTGPGFPLVSFAAYGVKRIPLMKM